METKIVNRGRGPEIAGSRITVYDVIDYLKHGWHRDRIATFFRLSTDDIQAAIDYIEDHKAEVMEQYQLILDRHRHYQYPSEVQQRLQQCRGMAKARLADLSKRRIGEVEYARDHG